MISSKIPIIVGAILAAVALSAYLVSVDSDRDPERPDAVFFDSSGHLPDWAPGKSAEQIESVCNDRQDGSLDSFDDIWCAEYIGYLHDGDGAITTFIDSAGYLPDWVQTIGAGQAGAICQFKTRSFVEYDTDKRWCVEYAAHIKDGDDSATTFADITGYTPYWVRDIGDNQAKSVCDIRERFGLHFTDADRHWCAEYAGYLNDGDGTTVAFADTTGYTPDWARGKEQMRAICDNRNYTLEHYTELRWCAQWSKTESAGDLYGPTCYPFDWLWCTEYAGYVRDRDGAETDFVDITGYIPDWARGIGAGQAKGSCDIRERFGIYLSDADRHWCAEYAGYLHDDVAVDFVDSTGYAPGWTAGADQTDAICDNHRYALADAPYNDRYWCGEYLAYRQYGAGPAAEEYLDIAGYTPAWTESKNKNQIVASCEARDLAGPDVYWCAEYLRYLQYDDIPDGPFEGFVDITGYTPAWTESRSKNQVTASCDNAGLFESEPDRYWCAEYADSLDSLVPPGPLKFSGFMPEWIQQKSIRQIETICGLELDTIPYCDAAQDQICIHDHDIVFKYRDQFWCEQYFIHLYVERLRPTPHGAGSLDE